MRSVPRRVGVLAVAVGLVATAQVIVRASPDEAFDAAGKGRDARAVAATEEMAEGALLPPRPQTAPAPLHLMAQSATHVAYAYGQPDDLGRRPVEFRRVADGSFVRTLPFPDGDYRYLPVLSGSSILTLVEDPVRRAPGALEIRDVESGALTRSVPIGETEHVVASTERWVLLTRGFDPEASLHLLRADGSEVEVPGVRVSPGSAPVAAIYEDVVLLTNGFSIVEVDAAAGTGRYLGSGSPYERRILTATRLYRIEQTGVDGTYMDRVTWADRAGSGEGSFNVPGVWSGRWLRFGDGLAVLVGPTETGSDSSRDWRLLPVDSTTGAVGEPLATRVMAAHEMGNGHIALTLADSSHGRVAVVTPESAEPRTVIELPQLAEDARTVMFSADQVAADFGEETPDGTYPIEFTDTSGTGDWAPRLSGGNDAAERNHFDRKPMLAGDVLLTYLGRTANIFRREIYAVSWPGARRQFEVPQFATVQLARGGKLLLRSRVVDGKLAGVQVEDPRSGEVLTEPPAGMSFALDGTWLWESPDESGVMRGRDLVGGGATRTVATGLTGSRCRSAALQVAGDWALVACPLSGLQAVDLTGARPPWRLSRHWTDEPPVLGNGFVAWSSFFVDGAWSESPVLFVTDLVGHGSRRYGPLRGRFSDAPVTFALDDAGGKRLVYADPFSQVRRVDLDWLGTPAPAAPEPERIVFAGAYGLDSMTPDSYDALTLVQTQPPPATPAYSPDGRTVVFGAYRDGYGEIFRVAVSGGDAEQLTSAGPANSRAPVYSPDGTTIAFLSNRGSGESYRLWIMRADGSAPTALTDELSVVSESQPVFAPDGSRIVVAALGPNGKTDLWAVSADGNTRTNLTNSPDASETHPSYSPDGTRLLYSTEVPTEGNGIDIELAVMNSDGTNRAVLPGGEAAADEVQAEFSPDGRRVVYSKHFGRDRRIVIMRADGSGRTELRGAEYGRDPTWAAPPGPVPTPTPQPSSTPTPTPTPTSWPTPTPSPTPPTFTPTPTPTPTTAVDSVSATLKAGETASTNLAVTPQDAMGSSVTTPRTGSVSITEGALRPGTSPPPGYSLLSRQVAITAPTATTAHPLHLQFRLDASLVAGGPVPTVFRNKVAVARCTNPAVQSATPDPCAESMRNLGGGDMLLIVRTSTAGTWTFGVPASPPPIDVAVACKLGGPAPQGFTLREGTSGDDVLLGTDGADILRGSSGDDILIGLGGNDLLCGGPGEDLLSGGQGNDRIRGDAGDDAAYGGSGNDALTGGSGDDHLTGGHGDDSIRGGSGSDLLLGSAGNDLLYGDGGADRLYGEDGHDRLHGGPGRDLLVPGRRR